MKVFEQVFARHECAGGRRTIEDREGSQRTLIVSAQLAAQAKAESKRGRKRRSRVLGRYAVRVLAMVGLPAVLALAGCGASTVAANSPNGSSGASSSGGAFSITPGTVTIDTNCTGCNGNNFGTSVEQFSAALSGGSAASVTWSLSGGDAKAGPGSISSSGQYTPPGYLTADSVKVTITATLNSNTSDKATAVVTVTPGFLQPLTPENVALGANGTLTVTGYLAEAGGSAGINYALSSTTNGSSGGQGTLGTPACLRSSSVFTSCTVTYTAPATIGATAASYIVATVGTSSSKTTSVVLLNTAGVESNPASHQQQLTGPVALGSSGGNNKDYDANSSGQVTDCCGGTLGALIQNSSGTQYLLSANHVLARSDQASVGETIVQPGLIDDNCAPFGEGGTETPVGTLTGFVPLKSSTTNVDAAIAQVNSGAVSANGSILELGTKQSDGTLAAAPPGVSSTGGKGEAGAINMNVAKSGRTTGLTCAAISAVNATVQVSYYSNCAETTPYYTKTFSNQLEITGNQFSDAGDSGSLIVDTNNAEPVGLFYAGGLDQSGVSQGVANPAGDVLSELGSQMGTSYSFVGTTDHPVSCLNYGDATTTAAQAHTLTDTESSRTSTALTTARSIVNPSTGILGVVAGKSSDRIGEGALTVYVDQSMNVSVPQTINGVRTVVIPTTAQALAYGMAPQTAIETAAPLQAAVLNQAIGTKQQIVAGLMSQNPAFFGVGVGQSLDNPKEAALVIYVDRRQVPAMLPATIDGLRVRYVIMERLHVTRSYATGLQSRSRCMSHAAAPQPSANDPFHLNRRAKLSLY
ncbi:MAG TPA: hypothetical protein VL991_03425 [Terracidiphilus sp.]|nr:hypothetical protein [Terracidiphilus sp.]